MEIFQGSTNRENTFMFYPLEPALLRPTSIIPALSKALKILMRDQMFCFLDSVGALGVCHSGFRSGYNHYTVYSTVY
jgi:hypothetical protein